MSIKSRIISIDDNGLIFNPATGENLTLSKTSSFILEALKNNRTKEEILRVLVEEYWKAIHIIEYLAEIKE